LGLGSTEVLDTLGPRKRNLAYLTAKPDVQLGSKYAYIIVGQASSFIRPTPTSRNLASIAPNQNFWRARRTL